MNPHIQSLVHNVEQSLQTQEPIQNGLLGDHIRSQIPENHLTNTDESHTNCHHIQTEPTNTFERILSPVKHRQIIDVQPNITVEYQRSTSKPSTVSNTLLRTTENPLNDGYIGEDNTDTQILTIESIHTIMNNDSSSTLKQYSTQQERSKHLITPPSSPATHELNRIWEKQENKSLKSRTTALTNRKNTKLNRPPCRLKNYGDKSDSDTTATETQNQDVGKLKQKTTDL